jgi:hypothetical protein
MLRDVQSFVSGTPRLILRLEALCLLAGTLWAFQAQHGGWALFAVLFFAPDLSMLGYLVNPKIGAATYNAAHTTVVYGPLAAYGYLSGFSVALAVGLIGLAHLGFDRLLGYGLKYPSVSTHILAARGRRLASCRPRQSGSSARFHSNPKEIGVARIWTRPS